jgi:predicted enzyme related to lactoylglutathione lyase
MGGNVKPMQNNSIPTSSVPWFEIQGVTIYLDVAAVQPAVDRAVAAGGKIVDPVTDIGPFGTIALIGDSDGNVVGVHTATAS